MAQSRGVSCILEMYSLEAFHLLAGNTSGCHPFKALIKDCEHIIRTNNMLWHTLRERNQCADCLAKLGEKQGEELVNLDQPPACLLPLIKADISSVSFIRERN